MAATPQPPHFRPWPLRFSLRALLLAFTAFAIGFPIWYRWPYEVKEPILTSPNMYHTDTWQRQWGGGRVRHGSSRTLLGNRLVALRTYRNDILEGPCQDFWSDGKLHIQGQHLAGERDGLWTEEIQSLVVARTHWKVGRLHGLSEQFGCTLPREPGQPTRLVFSEGRLFSLNGKPVTDRLATLMEDGTIDDPFFVATLDQPGASLQGDRTVYMFVAMTEAGFDIPLRIEYRYVDPNAQLVIGDWRELTPAACISATVASGGLICDYRYGCLWITTPRGLAAWREPTGVNDIEPPPGSPLANVWNEPLTFHMVQGLGLATVLENLASEVGIAIDTSQLSEELCNSDTLVDGDRSARKFKDVLGLILWEKQCRCELRGDTLAILPQGK